MDFLPPTRCGKTIRARCWASADELAAALSDELAKAAALPATSAIMLAGGTTPLAAYARLTVQPPSIDPGLNILFSDDRHVPPDSPQSNFGQVRPMLEAWRLTDERILRVHGDDPLPQAALRYDRDLAHFVGNGGKIGLGLLGLGADGHTASLFSERHIAEAQDRWAIPVQRPDGLNGISVTPRLLREVKRLLFVVSGTGKRAMAERLLKEPSTIPAGLAVSGHPAVELWTDQDAWPF